MNLIIVLDQTSNQIPLPVMEPRGAPISSSCHHLVGLYNWKILSVSEVLDLVRNDAFRGDIKQNKGVMISIQVCLKIAEGITIKSTSDI